jgi:antitoxin component of RelBE/YafQ-DinJ toxin-antitoxin module
MPNEAQVSATISATTKEELDRFTERLGLKKNFVVEQALLYFMASRRELPDEAFVPTRLVLEDAAFDALTAGLEAEAAPTARLVELLRR